MPDLGPFMAWPYEDTNFPGVSIFYMSLRTAFYYLPVNYRDHTGKNFWRAVEEIAVNAGGECGFSNNDGVTSVRVHIQVDKLVGKYDFLLEGFQVPTLARIVMKQMDQTPSPWTDHLYKIYLDPCWSHEDFKVLAWISYAAKFGKAEAERMLVALHTWQDSYPDDPWDHRSRHG